MFSIFKLMTVSENGEWKIVNLSVIQKDIIFSVFIKMISLKISEYRIKIFLKYLYKILKIRINNNVITY